MGLTPEPPAWDEGNDPLEAYLCNIHAAIDTMVGDTEVLSQAQVLEGLADVRAFVEEWEESIRIDMQKAQERATSSLPPR